MLKKKKNLLHRTQALSSPLPLPLLLLQALLQTQDALKTLLHQTQDLAAPSLFFLSSSLGVRDPATFLAEKKAVTVGHHLRRP
jgi:hypothetical protein